MLRTLRRQHDTTWRKQLPAAYIGEKIEKSTDNLLFDSESKNIPTPNYFVKKNPIDLAMAHDISLNKSVEKGVSKSWVGQSKGMLQVAWERGLLDLDRFCVEDFTQKGKLYSMVNIISNTSLSQFLTECSDFFEE